MPILWSCPPESSRGNRSRTSGPSPTRPRVATTLSPRSARGSPCTARTSARVERIESRGLRDEKGFWNTICILDLRPLSASPESPVTSSPSKTIRPESGSIRRRRSLPRVDFPQPDSPTRPRISPLPIARLTPFTAPRYSVCRPRMSFGPVGNRFTRPLASTRGEGSVRSPERLMMPP